MDTGSNVCRKLEGIEFGCIDCKDYELRKPVHGMGDAPEYVCVKNRDPKTCEVCTRNATQK